MSLFEEPALVHKVGGAKAEFQQLYNLSNLESASGVKCAVIHKFLTNNVQCLFNGYTGEIQFGL